MHPEDFLTLEEWHRLLAAAPTPREAAFSGSWPAEDAGGVAADIENLIALQIDVAVQSFDLHLHWRDEDVESLRKQRDRWVESDFHIRYRRALGIKGRTVRGAKVLSHFSRKLYHL